MENEIGEKSIYGDFESHTFAHGGFRFISKNNVVKRVDVKPSWESEIYFWSKVCFIPYEIHDQIQLSLQDNPYIVEFKQDENTQVKINENINKIMKEEAELYSEEIFLKHLEEETRRLGLFYHERDLYNFHISMKTQSLVVLAGMSGTGKTQLVNAYAKALGLPNTQVNIIPVRPSWTDDTDLIGYPDTLNNVYRPGDSGLINTLIKAENDTNNLYIVCFDEMNLARVEHYFSQFLSVLEMEEGKRVLKLYNEELANRFYNGDQYKPNIAIRDNVFFVGTVNLDESTYHFSDKVLDRSNVIELKILHFRNLANIEEKKKEMKPKDEKIIRVEDYNAFRSKQGRHIELNEQEIEFFWDFHNILQQSSLKLGIGPRVIRQIDKYIKNMPENCPFIRSEALDIQIVQRILTKIRGSEDTMQSLLGEYISNEDTVVKSDIFNLFDKYDTVSDFFEARKAVIEKAKELARNGYTI